MAERASGGCCDVGSAGAGEHGGVAGEASGGRGGVRGQGEASAGAWCVPESVCDGGGEAGGEEEGVEGVRCEEPRGEG